MKLRLVLLSFCLFIYSDESLGNNTPWVIETSSNDRSCIVRVYFWKNKKPSAAKADWTGVCRDGFAQGRGTVTLFNGSVKIGEYKGNILDGKMDGYGKFVEFGPNGSKQENYLGHWKNGLKHGYGSWASGITIEGRRYYEGHFEADKFHGRGTGHTPIGSVKTIIGEFVNGSLNNGPGHIICRNGTRRDFKNLKQIEEEPC